MEIFVKKIIRLFSITDLAVALYLLILLVNKG